MSSSSKIVTDQNGYFRHPEGYPLVVIFDSKQGKDKPPEEISWQEPVVGLPPRDPKKETAHLQFRKAQATPKPLKFVNTSRTGPEAYNRGTKRLARNHVKQKWENDRQSPKSLYGHLSTSSGHNAVYYKKAIQSQPDSASKPTSIPRQPFALLDPFVTFPIKIEPYICTLIYRYLSMACYSAKPSPLGYKDSTSAQGWLPLALTDAALLHSILCCCALSMDLLTAGRESPKKLKHMHEAVNLLSLRLQDPNAKISDSTIVAVAHLAEFESMEGNYKIWNLHMEGLYQMIKLRGGFAALDDGLESKVRRAEINGCLGTLSKPRFTDIDMFSLKDASSPINQSKSALCDGLKNVVKSFAFNNNLIIVLDQLQCLTSFLNKSTMDLLSIDITITPLQHQLLLIQTSGYESSSNAILQEVCCMAMLVYLRTIYHFHQRILVTGIPAVAKSDRAMIHRLKTCLEMSDIYAAPTAALFMWILFLGGIAVAGTTERAWFMSRLLKAIVKLQIRSWDDAKSLLARFLWVDRIHESPGKDLWEEAHVAMAVLFASDC